MNTHYLFQIALPYLRKANPDRVKHTLRVLRFAEYLARQEKADLVTVRIAAIFHDMGKYKETAHKHHALWSEELAAPLLDQLNLSPKKKDNILHCIRVHNAFVGAKTREAKVIQDADMLDRISPVRIANYFYYGGRQGHTLAYLIHLVNESWIESKHFNTKTARKLAKRKSALYKQFLHEFDADYVE